MSVTTRMTALITRSNPIRPGVVGTARVDRDIDRLLRRVCPGDIVVLDVLDLDRITADALVDAEIAAVVNASPSVSGRYPNLGPEVLMANGVTLIDETGPEVFKKGKDGAKAILLTHNETSTGVLNPLKEISEIVRESGKLLIVDSVSGCSIAIIFLSGETDATGVAGASSSVSIPCGGF